MTWPLIPPRPSGSAAGRADRDRRAVGADQPRPVDQRAVLPGLRRRRDIRRSAGCRAGSAPGCRRSRARRATRSRAQGRAGSNRARSRAPPGSACPAAPSSPRLANTPRARAAAGDGPRPPSCAAPLRVRRRRRAGGRGSRRGRGRCRRPAPARWRARRRRLAAPAAACGWRLRHIDDLRRRRRRRGRRWRRRSGRVGAGAATTGAGGGRRDVERRRRRRQRDRRRLRAAPRGAVSARRRASSTAKSRSAASDRRPTPITSPTAPARGSATTGRDARLAACADGGRSTARIAARDRGWPSALPACGDPHRRARSACRAGRPAGWRRCRCTNRPSRISPLTSVSLPSRVDREDRGQRAVARPFDIGLDAVVGDPRSGRSAWSPLSW